MFQPFYLKVFVFSVTLVIKYSEMLGGNRMNELKVSNTPLYGVVNANTSSLPNLRPVVSDAHNLVPASSPM